MCCFCSMVKCVICNRLRGDVNSVKVCASCWYADKVLKSLGLEGYYDDWCRLKTVDGVEYE